MTKLKLQKSILIPFIIIAGFVVFLVAAYSISLNNRSSGKAQLASSAKSSAQGNQSTVHLTNKPNPSSVSTPSPSSTTNNYSSTSGFPNPVTNTSHSLGYESWGCNESLYMGFTGPYTINSININTYCSSDSGSTNELDCSGNINTMLTTQSYPYAQLNMNCSTQKALSSYSWSCTQSLYTGFTGPDTINSISLSPSCSSESSGSNSLDCSGYINTMPTTQSYQYAQLNMNCST